LKEPEPRSRSNESVSATSELFTKYRYNEWIQINNTDIFPTSVADPDPGSGAFLTPGSRISKKSGSGINNQDHISESSETIFGAKKILEFFDADPGWKKFGTPPDPR
jgi:hypothetical protein